MAAINAQVLNELTKVGRKSRRPEHTFALRTRPWQIQPFMCAPVWPGETMKNLLLQARVVTDPIKNPLIGWWNEYYFFYVKLRDLEARDVLTNMLVTNAPSTSLNSGAKMATYHYGNAPDYAQMCLERVTDAFFRDEDETAMQFAVDGLPVAQVSRQSWLDSVILNSDVKDPGEQFPGEPTTTLPPNMASFSDHYAHWEAMRSMELTAVDFEDWLKTFGINVPKEETDPHEPELIRYIRKWQYPSNTVNPVDGSAASAVSWGIAERADKDRFFKEPGFIFGCQVTRPKIFMSKQKGSATAMLNDAFSWLPAVLQAEPYTSLKKFAAADGPLGGNLGGNDYWVDIRDLAMYGDQFINFELDKTDAGLVALPTPTLQKKYVTSNDMNAMFKNDVVANKIRTDGVVNMSILSRLEDTSG